MELNQNDQPENLPHHAAEFGSIPNDAESFRTIPHDAETGKKAAPVSETDKSHILELERENLDLRITNRAKDMVIEQQQKEREKFFDQLLAANRKMGELETKLLRLEEPRN